MKIFSINSSNSNFGFRGKYVNIKNSDDIKKDENWHKSSTIEQTLNSYHSNVKNKVYFASPMEFISDKIKEEADYIVYDNEPKYPDVNNEVSKNYFGTERKNYKDDFEEIRKYYYRREMGGFANVEEAKYQQWQAAECARMYDKGGHLRYVKEQAEDNIKKIESENIKINESLKAANSELNSQKDIQTQLDKHISNLEGIKKPYQELVTLSEQASMDEQIMYGDVMTKKVSATVNNQKDSKEFESYGEKVVKNYDEIMKQEASGYNIFRTNSELKQNVKKLEDTQKGYELIKDNCIKTINEIKKYIENLQAKLVKNNKEITEKKLLIEDCKSKLIPIFDELKNFYNKQGIIVVKNLK